MTDPARVRGFLDLFGDWDPTLAFVMGGTVLVMALAWLLQRRISAVFGEGFVLPDRNDLTPPRRRIGAVRDRLGDRGPLPSRALPPLAIAPGPAAIRGRHARRNAGGQAG